MVSVQVAEPLCLPLDSEANIFQRNRRSRSIMSKVSGIISSRREGSICRAYIPLNITLS